MYIGDNEKTNTERKSIISNSPGVDIILRGNRLQFTRSFLRPILPVPLGPLDIGGLGLWLDAADAGSVVLSGSNVSQWLDKSGLGKNATVAGTGPIYDYTFGINFNGSSSLKAPALLTTTNYSMFIVHRPADVSPSTEGNPLGVWKRKFGSFSIVGVVSNTVRVTTGVENSNSYAAPINVAASAEVNNIYMQSCILSSSTSPNSSYNSTVTINGVETTSSGTSVNGNIASCTEEIGIGCRIENGYPVGQYNGRVSEIIIFNVALGAIQRQQIEGYLAWKWGLQSSLPANHPFRNNAPTK